MKKKVTAPLSYDPGKGRPKEHLAYLNWQEMQQLQRLNGGNMERGPRGLPSFPPADAIGSSSKASSSKPSGGGGRDSGSRDKGGAGTYKSVSGKGSGASTSRSSGPSVRGPVSRIPNSPSGVSSINVGPMQMPVSLGASRTPKTIKSLDNTDQIAKLGQKYNLPNFSPEKYNLAKKILSQPVPTDSLNPYSPSYRESISDYLNKSLYGDNLEGAQRVEKILGVVDTLAYAAPSIPLAKITEPVLKYVAKPVYNFVKGSSAGKAAKYGIDPRIQAELDAVYPAGKTEKPFMTEADVNKVLKKSDPTRSAAAKAEHYRATQPLPGERAWGTVEDYLDEATKALGLGTGDVARAKFAAGMGGAQEAAMYGVEKFSDYPSRNYENSEKGDYGGMRDGGMVGSKSKKQKITAPLSYNPGRGRPKEHLAYLNWQEMQQLQRLNGNNIEFGPRGLPSFPPADAIGSSSRATSSKTSGSRGPGGGSLSAPSRTAPSSGRGFQDSRGGGGGRDSGARGNVGMGKAPSGSKTPGYGGGGRDAGRAAPKPSSLGKATSGVGRGISKEEAARIVSRLDEMSKRLEREQKAIFANRPDYLARGKIQDRVISAAEGQPYRMSTPTVYTSAPPRVTPAPTFSVNAMTTDLGRLQRGMRDRISQEAFIQAGYMPGFKSLGDIERDRKISAAVGQPYGMKTPISPARGQPYGVKSPISPARGQPYGMNLPPSNVPSTEISAKTIPVKKDISDISKLTDEYSLASGMSFRGFPTIGAGQVEQRPTLAGTSSVIPRTPEDHMTSVLGTSYAQRWYPGEQMFRTPQEISRDIAGYSSAGIDALERSKIYSDRIPSDSSAPVSPSAQVPNANVTVLQKAREPLRPFYAGASEGLPPGYSDRYLNKQADTSGETVLQVEDVPIESEFATKEEVKEAAKKAGFRPSVYESEDFLSDPNRLGMMAESPEDISPTDMAKLVSRAYGENYLTRSEKDRLAASRIAQAAMKLNPLARLAVFGAEKVIKPENVKAFLARPSYEQEELYRLGREMDERYGRREPGQTASLTQYSQDSGGQYGGSDLGRGDRGGGIGGLPDRGRGPSSGAGQAAPPATQASGRPYIYYQWDVGVNIPSPGDPDYTNYQEYLRRRAQAQA